MLTLADQRPGIIVVGSHAGEPNVSRVGAAAGVFGGDEPSRHISVRMPFADERAEAFMTGEARQLSGLHGRSAKECAEVLIHQERAEVVVIKV